MSQTITDNASLTGRGHVDQQSLTASDTAIGAQTFINSVIVPGYQSPSSTGSARRRAHPHQDLIVGHQHHAHHAHHRRRRRHRAPRARGTIPKAQVARGLPLGREHARHERGQVWSPNRQLLSADEQARSAHRTNSTSLRAQFKSRDRRIWPSKAAKAPLRAVSNAKKQMEDATSDADKESHGLHHHDHATSART